MRPITILTAIILGSCLAITISLIAVWILLSLVSNDPEFTSRVASELSVLPSHVATFIPLTGLAALTFLASQKEKWHWWIWQLLLWTSLIVVGIYYYRSMTA